MTQVFKCQHQPCSRFKVVQVTVSGNTTINGVIRCGECGHSMDAEEEK